MICSKGRSEAARVCKSEGGHKRCFSLFGTVKAVGALEGGVIYRREAKAWESSYKPLLKLWRPSVSVGLLWVLGMFAGSLLFLPRSLPFCWILTGSI